jgi:cytochrome c-type biogenesis protein CcmH
MSRTRPATPTAARPATPTAARPATPTAARPATPTATPRLTLSAAVSAAVSAALRLAVVVAIALSVTAPPSAAAATPRASLTGIENDVMCVVCHESLAVASSPQADSERAYIRLLISQGQTKPQIEHALVAQYGPSVLALPPAHGFNLTVYIVPPLILAIGIVTLVITLPRWRRRSRAASQTPLSTAPELDPGDARRLDEDLARRS